MNLIPSIITIAILAGLTAAATAQNERYRHNPYLEIQELEKEIFHILDQLDGLLDAADDRNAQLKQLQNQRDRASGQEKTKVDLEINAINNQARISAVQSSRLNLALQRKQMEVDRVARFIEFASHHDGGGRPGGGPQPGKAPEIRAIKEVRTNREGPVRVSGKGVGHYDVTVYEVTFADGSSQRFEDKQFVPQR